MGSAKLAQDAVEDASVLEVQDLVGRVESDPRLESDLVRALALRRHLDRLGVAVLEVPDVEGLLPGKAEGLDRLAAGELEREDAHPDQVGAVDPLQALRDHRS